MPDHDAHLALEEFIAEAGATIRQRGILKPSK
jgi:hypothetical protein